MKDWFLRSVFGRVERAQLRSPMLVVTLVVVALVSAGVAYCARSAEADVQVDCHEYAAFAAYVSTYRYARADLERVVDMVRRANRGIDEALVRVYEAETRRVFLEQLSQDDAEASAFKRCMDQLGRFPRAKES